MLVDVCSLLNLKVCQTQLGHTPTNMLTIPFYQ